MEEVKKVKATKSCLRPGVKVELVIIRKHKTANVDNADDAALLQGCSVTLMADVDRSGRIRSDILTPEESAELELKLSLGKDGLNTNKPVDNFWHGDTSTITLKRTSSKLESSTITLDLGDPYDYIKHAICLKHRLVCPTWGERRSNPDYKYSLRNLEDEQAEKNSKALIGKTVHKYLLNNDTSHTKLYNLLRLFNQEATTGIKKLSHKQSVDWLFTQLYEYASDPKHLLTLYRLITMKASLRDSKVMLLNGVSSGALLIRGSIYSTSDGAIIGYSEGETIEYINDPVNQPVKMKIKANIDKYLKGLE